MPWAVGPVCRIVLLDNLLIIDKTVVAEAELAKSTYARMLAFVSCWLAMDQGSSELYIGDQKGYFRFSLVAMLATRTSSHNNRLFRPIPEDTSSRILRCTWYLNHR